MLHDKEELKLQRELWLLYEFPVAAIISYSRLGGLEQKKLPHRSEGQSSESKMLEVLWASQRGKSAPCLFQLQVAASIPWLMGASLDSLPPLVAFSSSVHVTSFCLSYLRTVVVAFGGYPENPG